MQLHDLTHVLDDLMKLKLVLKEFLVDNNYESKSMHQSRQDKLVVFLKRRKSLDIIPSGYIWI